MADQKISQLTGGGAAQATDEYVVARAGGNNKITGANVAAAATSVGTLTSLTVSGDLTVDTDTLKVSSSANAVFVGTTTSLAVGGGFRKIQVQDTTGTVGISVVRNTTTAATGGAIALGRSRGTVVNDVTAVQAGDFLGLVQFSGADGTDLNTIAARIAAVADGTISTGVVPGYLRLDTADASGNLNEVVRVTSDRRLEIRASNNGITDGTSVNVLRFVDTDTSTATGQGVGAIEFYTSDTTAPGARVVGAIRSVAPGASGGASLAFDVAANAGTKVESFRLPSQGGAVVGTAALATNATNGFLYVPTCAGTPTGTPVTQTGTAPIIVDTTNHKLYFYSGGSWQDAGP